MGRRSQRSRAGQAKDRTKRAVKDSDRPDDDTDKPSETGVTGEGQVGDTQAKPLEEETTGGDDDVDTQDEPLEDEATGGEDDGDTADEPTDTEATGGDDDVDAQDVPSDTEATGGDDDGDTADEPTDTEATGREEDDDTSLNNGPDDALAGELEDDIAAGYASIEADQNPQTCCSNCKTIFEVSPELLSSSDTRVRCGECLSIFDALANLRHQNDKEGDELDSDFSGDAVENDGERPDAGNSRGGSGVSGSNDESPAGSDNNAYSLDVTYADFSLFSADAALPDIDYLDETREATAFDFDDPGGDDDMDETYSETLFAHGPEVDARSAIDATDFGNSGESQSAGSGTLVDTDGLDVSEAQKTAEDAFSSHDATVSRADNADEIDELLDSLQRPEPHILVEEKSASSWWLRSALLLLALSLAGGLYGYRERESLQHSQNLRPALESLCSVIGCTLAEQVDLASLQVLKRSVFSHPKLDNMLVINVGFVNKAAFSQRYPVLEIRLTDRNGGLVVKNSFEPSDYLDNWQKGDVLDAGGRLDISLNVEDPGNQAMSFELAFR